MKPFGTICFEVTKPKFNLATTKEGIFWRKKGEAFVEKNTLQTLKQGGGSIILLDCVAAVCIVWVDERMDMLRNSRG